MEIGTFEVTYIIGALLIIGTSLEKYQQPSLRGKKRYLYERFSPKYVTSNTRYYTSMIAYNLLMLGLYALLVLVKDSETVIKALGFPEDTAAESFPLIAAMAIMGAQNLPYINKLEAVVRSWCHAWAKIPSGVRQTRDDIDSVEFNFTGYRDRAALKSDQLLHVDEQDFDKGRATTEWKWARISCVLFGLERARHNEAEGGQFSKGDINAFLFEEYEDEYEQILQSHRALGSAIEAFKNRKRTDSGWIGSDDYRKLRETLHKDMGRLDEQLVWFVACAVRSKQATESQIRISLAKLGFKLADTTKIGISSDSVIIILAIIFAIVVATVITSQSLLFDPLITKLTVVDGEEVKENIEKIPLYVPQKMADALIWGFYTIMAHGAAIAGSHYSRLWAIRRKYWPEWNSPEGRASVSWYFYISIVGGVIGTVALALLNMVYMVLMGKDMPVLEAVDILLLTVVWSGVFFVTALFTAIHLDTTDDSRRNIFKWLVIHTAAAFVVTYFCASIFIDHYHNMSEEMYLDFVTIYKRVIIALVVLISIAMAILMPFLHIKQHKQAQDRKKHDATHLKEEQNGYTAELSERDSKGVS
jgi:uncharacterized membrane protein